MLRSDKKYYIKNAQYFCPYWQKACADNTKCMTQHCEFYVYIPCFFYQEKAVAVSNNVLDGYILIKKPAVYFFCNHDKVKVDEKYCLKCKTRERGSNFLPIYKIYKLNQTKEQSEITDSLRRFEIPTKMRKQVRKFVLPQDQLQLEAFFQYLRKHELSFTCYERNHHNVSIVYYDQFTIEL